MFHPPRMERYMDTMGRKNGIGIALRGNGVSRHDTLHAVDEIRNTG